MTSTMEDQPCIIFLDFDGVLHPSDAYEAEQLVFFSGARALFKWVPLLATALAQYLCWRWR